MDIRQLRYFVRIVAAGSFSKAAAELHVAQPALSQHVANLEAELGVELLARSTRGVLPTECGRILVGHAEAILRQVEHAARDVKHHSASPSGKVTIGLPSSTSLVLTVPLLIEVERLYPDVSLQIIEGHSGYLIEWVKSGRTDLSVIFDGESTQGLNMTPLLTENLYLVCAPETFASDREDVAASDLVGLPLILTGRSQGVRAVIEHYAQAVGWSLEIKSELDALPAIKQLVAAGFGFSILPWSAIHHECLSGALQGLMIVQPCMTRQVQIATASDRPLLRATEVVGRLVHEIAVRLAREGQWRGTLPLVHKATAPTASL